MPKLADSSISSGQNSRRLITIGNAVLLFSLAVAATLGLLNRREVFKELTRTQTEAHPILPAKEKNLEIDTVPALHHDGPTKTTPSETPIGQTDSPSCENLVWNEFTKTCDEDCFVDKLRERKSPLAEFYDDGWADSHLPIELSRQRTPTGKLFFALGAAGLLAGNFKFKNNYPLSIKVMDELILQQPNNAALYIFAMTIALRNNQSDLAKHYNSQMLDNASYYDSNWSALSKELLRESLVGPFDYPAAASLRSSLPIPNFSEIRDVLLDQSQLSLDTIAIWMMQPGLQSKGAFMDSHWIPWEYSIAQIFLTGADLERATRFPTLQQLFEHPDAFEFGGKIFVSTTENEDCDVNAIIETKLFEIDQLRRKAFAN